MRGRWAIVLVIVGGLLAAGCQQAGVGRPGDGAGAAFLLDDEPPGARGVLETKAALESDGAESPAEVVVAGRIGGATGFIWDPERAAFTLVDAAAAGDEGPAHGGAGHGSDGCPFCREKEKKAMAATALVQMVDARDQVPPIDARQLLGLAEGQTIVVVGAARIDSLGHLDIRARQLHVRR